LFAEKVIKETPVDEEFASRQDVHIIVFKTIYHSFNVKRHFLTFLSLHTAEASVDAVFMGGIGQGLDVFGSGFIGYPHGAINDEAAVVAEDIDQVSVV
jgi:hypothetical protein